MWNWLEYLKNWNRATPSPTPATPPSEDTDPVDKEPPRKITIHEWLYWTILVVWLSITGILAYLALTDWQENTASFLGVRWVLGEFIVLLLLALNLMSIYRVRVTEILAVEFLGLPVIHMGAGPKLIPWPIFQVWRLPAVILQRQYPDEPEMVQKGDDKLPLEVVTLKRSDGSSYERQKVRPIRITTAPPSRATSAGATDEENALDSQMTLEVSFWTRHQIERPFHFLVNTTGDTVGEKIEDAVRQMRDSGEKQLIDEIGKRTPAEVIRDLHEINAGLPAQIGGAIQPWGIKLHGAAMFSPDVTHTVNIALRDVAVAKASAIKVRTAANAERYKREQEGLGQASATKADYIARGEGMKQQADTLGLTPAELLAAEIASKTIGEGTIIVGTDGIAQAIGLGAAILKDKKPKGDTP